MRIAEYLNLGTTHGVVRSSSRVIGHVSKGALSAQSCAVLSTHAGNTRPWLWYIAFAPDCSGDWYRDNAVALRMAVRDWQQQAMGKRAKYPAIATELL